MTGRDGAPLPAGTAERLGGDGHGPDPGVPARQGPDRLGRAVGGGRARRRHARALDLGVRRGDLRDVRGTTSRSATAVAAEGHVQVGDVLPARLEDTTEASLRVAAIYDRAAGLGHVVMDRALAHRHAAVPPTRRCSWPASAPAAHPGTQVLTRAEYLGTVRTLGQSGAWGVWVIIGLSIAFAALSLVNTAAMATAERRGELATIRLLGGTRLAGDPDGRARARPDRARRAVRRRRRRGGLGDGRAGGRPRHRARACRRRSSPGSRPVRRCSASPPAR